MSRNKSINTRCALKSILKNKLKIILVFDEKNYKWQPFCPLLCSNVWRTMEKKFFCMRKQLFEWVHKNTIELQSLKNENFWVGYISLARSVFQSLEYVNFGWILVSLAWSIFLNMTNAWITLEIYSLLVATV